MNAGIFSCTTFESGRSFLDADFTITCYDQTHWNYIGAAIIWLFVVTLGIPMYFIWLLRRFKVPGGWLYMVEIVSGQGDHRGWNPPIFIPDGRGHGDGPA